MSVKVHTYCTSPNALLLVLLQHWPLQQLNAKVNSFLVSISLPLKDCPTHCNQCSSTSICTGCKNSYILYQAKCLYSCPDGMFLSATTCEGTFFFTFDPTILKDCPAHCNHCNSTSICTECISPFVLYDSQCLKSCPNAMFNSNNICRGKKSTRTFHLIISQIVHLIVLPVFLKTLAKYAIKDIFSPTLFVFYQELKKKH